MANPNLVKSVYTVNTDDARVIDNNARAEERIIAAQEEWMRRMQEEQRPQTQEAYDDFGDEFDEGLNPEQLDMLTSDQNVIGTPEGLEDADFDDGMGDYAEESAPPPPPPAPQPAPQPEPAPMEAETASSEEIEELLLNAQTQADQIIADAKASAAQLTALAHEQGFTQGLEEGRAKGEGEARAAVEEEIEARRQELEEEYQQRLNEIEPEMVETLTRIYEHVFDVNLREEKKVILHLLQTTLSRIEPNGDFMIHVSSADYDTILDHKEALREYITNPNAMLEVVEDPLLHENECMIETDGGIFDCSLGVELSELARKLKLLAMDRRRR